MKHIKNSDMSKLQMGMTSKIFQSLVEGRWVPLSMHAAMLDDIR